MVCKFFVWGCYYVISNVGIRKRKKLIITKSNNMKHLAIIFLVALLSCDKPKSCIAPTNLTPFNIAINGASFRWNSTIIPASGFWWRIVRVSDNREMIRNTGLDTYHIVGNYFEVYIYALQGEIESGKTYRLDLAAMCSPDDVSDWASVTFTTN